jgi:hypothetical protein
MRRANVCFVGPSEEHRESKKLGKQMMVGIRRLQKSIFFLKERNSCQ